MLFDTSEIAPASSAWRQPLQMRARSENVNGLDWEVDHFNMDVDTVAFHEENNYLIVYGAKRDQCSIAEIMPTTSSTPKISISTAFNPPSPIYDMHWGRKNDLLCASSEGRVLRYSYDPSRSAPREPNHVYTLTKLKATGRPGYSTRVRRVSAHSTSSEIFGALENGNLHIWETESGDLTISKKISESVLTALSWSPHFVRRVMVGGFSRGLKLFDVNSGEVVWKKDEAHSVGLITDIAFHPFVPWWLASAGEDGVAKVWDLRCGARALVTLDEHYASVRCVEWSPTHTEILATGSFDRQFKMWSLNLPPHYVIVNKRESAPVVGAGFLKRMRFHACGVIQDGTLVVAKLSDQFVEPLVPRLEGELGTDTGAEVSPEREVARLIYFRDFSVAFERALTLAEKLSHQHQPELALAVLDLAYQRSTPSLDPNVHPDTPLTEALHNFNAELKNYSYYVPPGYHTQFGTQVKDEVMDRIQTLRLRLELERAASSNLCSDILDRTKDIVELLEKDTKIFPPSLLANLIKIIMPYDLIRAIEAAIEIADVLAVSGDFNIFLPIARLLLFPTIYESDLIYEHDTEEKREEKIKQTQADDRQLVEKLLNKNDILDQLTFMKKFYVKLWGEHNDMIDFFVDNQPTLILSASINRTYLNLLLSHHQYSTFYSYAITLQKETKGSKFAEQVQTTVSQSFARVAAYVKDTSDPPSFDEKDKTKSTQMIYSSLARVENAILNILKVLYNSAIFPFPDELTDLLDQSLKPLTQQLEKHYIIMLKIRETDNSKPSSKSIVSSKAKELEEKINEVTEGKKNNSDGIFSEKDLKRLHNSLAGFF